MRRSLIALIALLLTAPAAGAQERHEHSANMRHVKNLPYAAANGGTPNYGTDIEFATLAGKRYALAGSYKNGLQIVDISEPSDARIVSTYDCGVTQGDVQVFHKADEPRSWMGAKQAAAYFAGLPKVSVTRRNALICLLPQQ